MKDQKSPNIDFSNPTEADRYKAEAMAYQEEINEIVINPTETEGQIATETDNSQNLENSETEALKVEENK